MGKNMSPLLDNQMSAPAPATRRSPAPGPLPSSAETPAPDLVESPRVGGTWAGKDLTGTLWFLGIPVSVIVFTELMGMSLGRPLLWSVAVISGLAMVLRSFRNPEWLVAATIIYIPLNKVFVVPLAPGINGTNAIIALLLLAWIAKVIRDGGPLFRPLPLWRPVLILALLGVLSAITSGIRFGADFILYEHLLDLKGWLDQFIILAALLNLTKDAAMARRLMVYGAISLLATMGLGTVEWLEKADAATMEKARVLGPQMQPNDFGAILVYGSGPMIGIALGYMTNVITWVVGPAAAAWLIKLLLVSYSRGAYIGMALGAVGALWTRGRLLFISGLATAALVVLAFPQIIPNALLDRMGQTESADDGGEELDKSSGTRLVLWTAAGRMILESPLTGKGFKAFPALKADYTDIDVEESDNHNMFLYIASQMGIPALLALLWIMGRAYWFAAQMGRHSKDPLASGLALGCCCTLAGAVGVNMFGSRLVDMGVSLPFWLVIVIVSHLWVEHSGASRPAAPSPVRR